MSKRGEGVGIRTTLNGVKQKAYPTRHSAVMLKRMKTFLLLW